MAAAFAPLWSRRECGTNRDQCAVLGGPAFMLSEELIEPSIAPDGAIEPLIAACEDFFLCFFGAGM
jgi:hypothetical protein